MLFKIGLTCLALLLTTAALPVHAAPWSARMADSVMKRTPDPMWLDASERPRWEYTQGLVLKSILEVGERTGDDRYWKYAQAYYDGMIDGQGTIRDYRLDEYNIDRINPGKPLFLFYEKTRDEKYRKAIETLRRQLREHPRTREGGFWHKKRYPHQMWLDGLYMGAPFLAQYAKVFNEPAAFDDVINQFVWMETHARDEKTGLLFHGWDESREQKWADPKTGRSPAFWGRAMGWYAMGLVDTLDFIPPDHPRRGELSAILGRLAEAATRVQDPKSGVWWQVVDQGSREGNYLEASVSTMFAYAFLKASRLGYIDAKYRDAGRRAYQGILSEFIEVDKDGLVDIHRVCQVAGLGGDPANERYRDGTFKYYVNERIRSNDPKAVGPFILASLEIERAAPGESPGALRVTVRNELPMARPSETVELTAAQLAPLGNDLARVHVFDGKTEILAQALEASLIFQIDVPALGTRSFEVRMGEPRTYKKNDFRVYGRFVRERFDDFAWENDRVAHRMYGAALETWQKEPLTSSTLDVWLKRTRRLVINEWYMTDDYHRDHGEGADFYSAGRSRGCGANGLWRDGRLVVSKNFRNSRVLANGPIRLVFELSYPVWDAADVRSETKRITLDAGQNFGRFESRYDVDGDVVYAAGIKKQPGATMRVERQGGWMRTWEPVKGGTGQFGCAIVLDPASIVDVTEGDGNYLIVARAPAVYWAGSGWDQSGDFAGVEDWDRAIEQWTRRVKSPLKVSVP